MKLSIITINYNNLAGLRKTVASVLAQTWRDFEWIIVDGGSTDGSKEYIEQLAQDLSQGVLPNSLTPSLPNSLASSPWRVAHFSNPSYTAQDPSTNHPVILSSNHPSSLISNRESLITNPSSHSLLWCSEPDKGIYNAMNKGIQMVSGEYLNFMNSGDCFYESDTLEKVFSQDYTADILYGEWKRVWSDREDIKSFPYPIEIYSFYKENICHQAMFIRRDYHICHLYDEYYKILADYKNWILAAFNGAVFLKLSSIVCIVTMDGLSNQLHSDFEKLNKEIWKDPLKHSMHRLDYQLHEPYQLRVRTLLDMGGVPKLITKSFLKVMKLLYLRDIDEIWR